MRSVLLAVTILLCCATMFGARNGSWQPGETVKPEELAGLLSRPGGVKPLVLQVGVQVLYRNGHIPGSKYVGAGWSPAGIQKLMAEVTRLPRSTPIVLYCGCCPWDDCPNVRPAFETLRKLGFKDTRVLYMPTNFQQEWVAKGYPTARGDTP